MKEIKKMLKSLLAQDFSKLPLAELEQLMFAYRGYYAKVKAAGNSEVQTLLLFLAHRLMMEMENREQEVKEKEIGIILTVSPEAVLETMEKMPMSDLVLLIRYLQGLKTTEIQLTLLLFADDALKRKASNTQYEG